MSLSAAARLLLSSTIRPRYSHSCQFSLIANPEWIRFKLAVIIYHAVLLGVSLIYCVAFLTSHQDCISTHQPPVNLLYLNLAYNCQRSIICYCQSKAQDHFTRLPDGDDVMISEIMTSSPSLSASVLTKTENTLFSTVLHRYYFVPRRAPWCYLKFVILRPPKRLWRNVTDMLTVLLVTTAAISGQSRRRTASWNHDEV